MQTNLDNVLDGGDLFGQGSAGASALPASLAAHPAAAKKGFKPAPASAKTAAPFSGQYDHAPAGRAGAATAGIGGGAVVGGSVAGPVADVVTGGVPATNERQAADPMSLGETILGDAKDIGKLAGKTAYHAGNAVMDAKAAKKDWGGKEKLFSYDAASGTVQKKTRGKDTDRVNGFKKELAEDKAESAVHSGIKAVTSAAKGTSYVLDDYGVPVGDTVDALGLNPIANAGKMAAGTHRMVEHGVEVVRHQEGKNAARQGEHAAHERGDLLEHGLHQAKVAHSDARNDAGRNVAIGAAEATTGALGMAQTFDPSGGTAGAQVVMNGVTKGAKKGNTLYNAVTKGLHWDDLQKHRKLADAGNPESIEWVSRNDARHASAQMLMHTQRGDEGSKAFAQEHVASTLRLGGDAKAELADGKLSEFDKVYAGRTGQDIEGQLKPKEALVYGAVRPAAKKINKWFGGDKKAKKDSFGPQDMPERGGNGLSANDAYFAREAARLSNALEKEEAVKTLGGDGDQQAAAFDGVDRGVKPMRAQPIVREYDKVKDFRHEKTHAEMIDKAEQKSLKSRHTAADADSLDKLGEKISGKADGKLYNPSSFGSAAEMVDKTHEKIAYGEGPEGAAAKAKTKAAKAAKMPWAESKEMPADIRGGVIKKEDERRAGTRSVGLNLPTAAPAADWRDQQKQANKAAKAAKAQRKATSADALKAVGDVSAQWAN